MAVPVALTIAGSDSGGGAGIQADLKTFAALGVFGTSAITALTAQNTLGVTAIHDAPPQIVTAQIDAVFDDFEVGAVKIGMVSSQELIAAIAAALDRWKPRAVVFDPVMVASSGNILLEGNAIEALRSELIPRAHIITPNLPEASTLLGQPIARTEGDVEMQGRALLELGCPAVLIKGGHGDGPEAVDYLVTAQATVRLAAPRTATQNTHGTGCTLSSAIAAELAKGASLEAAVREAKSYITGAIAAADRVAVGHGHGPVNHFYRLQG